MNKLYRLTWKYFWQQKVKEVSLLILITGSITLLPYYLGRLALLIFGKEKICKISGLDSYNCILRYDHLWDIGFIVLLIILIIILVIYQWIKSNWKKAKRRAEKEIKNG